MKLNKTHFCVTFPFMLIYLGAALSSCFENDLNFQRTGFNGLSCLQIRGEREIQQRMMLQEEETLEMRETFSSLQQEVELKTKKLRRVR